ncbi:DUF4935 domain-containing protein [Elizabethkingia anophelis]|uniref:PIN domain-containing protein n=1 Tax=Chryseobacterium sp. PCH239 TaxID=2825845 RepID=UPI001C12732B|nr:PIN domain-containing protein [Chryseobacterium sp. PCH239]MCT4073851.1 DUF4935 domain-containing protein [Elizabethkingia anophelis]QWT86111.1 DUF4935 domain-containing protein [Chryseobacterium sp. PCH239]
MDIVLDSNIYRGDWYLKSNDFTILRDYLSKTDSSFVLPQIILEEITGLYKRNLEEEINSLSKTSENLNYLLNRTLFEELQVNIEQESDRYIKMLIRKLGLTNSKIVKYDNDFLPKIIKRAIQKRKPFKDEDRGFRDCIIWLTLLKYTEKSHEKQIVFISNNPTDFGDNKQNPILHPDLQKDCDELNIKVNYFKSIKEFTEKHSKKIDEFDIDWLSENIDISLLSDIAREKIDQSSPRYVKNWFEWRTELDSADTFKTISVNFNDFEDIFIYEMVNGDFIINFTGWADTKINFEYYDYGYFENTIKNKTEIAKTVFYVSAVYKNNVIEEIEINDFLINKEGKFGY